MKLEVQKTINIDSLNTDSNSNILLKHHILFWLIYFLFNTLRWGNYFDDYSYSLKTNLLGFPLHMALSYFNAYYLMPKFVYQRFYIKYILSIILSLGVILMLKYSLTYYLAEGNVFPEGPDQNAFTLKYAISTVMGELYVVAFTASIKLTIDWINNIKKLNELKKLSLETELKYLRSQIHPHFFFNTLNNLYSLTMERSLKAPEVVLKLSELMKYVLYETKEKKQYLTKEILHIHNYLELEKIRYGERLKIDTAVLGDIEGKKINTLLLLPFVENCFKHGANKIVGNINISIEFKVEENQLTFTVINSIPENTDTVNTLISPHGGIGIKNVKKRLELGYNKEDYNLTIEKMSDTYKVELKILVV